MKECSFSFNLAHRKRRIIKYLSIFVAITPLLFCGVSSAQDTELRAAFTDAEYYFLYNDHAEALPLYMKVYEHQPNNANINYRIGLCYLNLPGQKHKALEFLQVAIQNISSTYQEGSFREDKAPINAFFYLGEAHRICGNLDKAIETYQIFREMLDTKDVYNLDFVDHQINACNRAKIMMQNPLSIKKQKISLFDSEKYIFSPVVSGNRQTLAFTVHEKFYDGIFISQKDSKGNWGTPINITLELGVEGEVFTTSLSHDGLQLFLFKNDKGIGNIYSSIFINDKWQPAQKLSRRISTRNWETSASISPDGNTLFFSSNRRGSIGGLDIFYSNRLPNGDWSEPINIGDVINTPYNEEAPFLSNDGNTLYFISQGHNSIGGYDIFYSERIGENEWSTPINLGYPINTPDDDLYYFPLNPREGLIASVEKDNPSSRNLYHVTIAPTFETDSIEIFGNITLANRYEVEGRLFTISLIDEKNQKILLTTHPEDITGAYRVVAKAGSYNLKVKGEGYTEESVPLFISSSQSQPIHGLEIVLTPETVTAGEYVVIRSILFDFDRSELTREATFELEKVLTIMEKYPTLTIEITGHTDSKGSASYNYKLSQKRAQAVIDYLTSKGISDKRMVARAASAFENVAANFNPDGTDNPAGRRLNRRASITIIQSDEKVSIEEDLSIPEHLKPREQTFVILLAPINTNISASEQQKLERYSEMRVTKHSGTNNKFAFSIGCFDHKSKAIDLLNFAIDNGFPNATIIGEVDLQRVLALPNSTKK